MLRNNALRINIAQRYRLRDIITAHELVESGKAIGNVVLMIDHNIVYQM